MPRESECERQIIADLNSKFSYDMLTMADVMSVTGYKSKDTVLKHYGDLFSVGHRIHKVSLAKRMCSRQTK